MFKKLIIAAISASFLASAAFADSTNIGVRLSAATMAASGTENTNLVGTNVSQAEKDADFILPSIFIEKQMDLDSGISIAALNFVIFFIFNILKIILKNHSLLQAKKKRYYC